MRRLLVVAILFGLLAAASLASAQGSRLELAWFAIEGGGTTSASAGDLELSGTIGQPEAGTLSSENLVLYGGFLGAAGTTGPPDSVVYLPLILRNR
jgi:hypothetical protein